MVTFPKSHCRHDQHHIGAKSSEQPRLSASLEIQELAHTRENGLSACIVFRGFVEELLEVFNVSLQFDSETLDIDNES